MQGRLFCEIGWHVLTIGKDVGIAIGASAHTLPDGQGRAIYSESPVVSSSVRRLDAPQLGHLNSFSSGMNSLLQNLQATGCGRGSSAGASTVDVVVVVGKRFTSNATGLPLVVVLGLD